MPHKFKKPCAYPGCPNLTDEQYCPEHKKFVMDKYNQFNRDTKKKYGNNWRRIRALYVKQHPLCERCLKEGRITPVDEVHHILPVRQGGSNAFSNLMSLCHSCHEKVHQEMGDRPRGGANPKK